LAEAPDLVLAYQGKKIRLRPGQKWTVGRDAACDVVIAHSSVSRHHGEFVVVGDAWKYRDTASANRSWVDGHETAELTIDRPMRIGLGRDSGVLLEISLAPAADSRRGSDPLPAPQVSSARPKEAGRVVPEHVLHPMGRQMTIGRGPDNDVVVNDLLVSRSHAAIKRISSNTFEVVDLGSTNGTFVNGQRVSSRSLNEGDIISLGRHVFRLSSAGLSESAELDGPWLCALNVGVETPSGKRLVHTVRFALPPRRFLSIAGPSGAGKSTLLRALTGQEPTDIGTVLYGGRDLYESLDLRQKMGYVPQQDLLHPQLTGREALEYSAELRFARDVDAGTRSARVDEVVRELGLDECQLRQIASMSGGERKRTCIAAELLTKPPLLFLDEPTSGLDPGNEYEVTKLLRNLADGGRTVVAATHSLVTLDQCDSVLFLAKGGHQAYFGPPKEARTYFEKAGAGGDYPLIFDSLDDERRAPGFASRFAADPVSRKNVEEPLAAAKAAQATHPSHPPDAPPNSDRVRQWWVLVRRYLSVIKSDRPATLILLAQAPFFALLFNIMYPSNVMSTAHAYEATILTWLMVVGATWIGTSNAVREMVKEDSILRREHGLGLSLATYVASKVAVLGMITAAECAFLALATLLPFQRLPASDPSGTVAIAGSGVALGPILPELVLDVVVAGLAAMAVGLLVSTLVRTADQANFALPLLLVAQVVLSAPVLGSPGPVFAALGTASSAQWGMAAVAATVSLNDVRQPYLNAVEQFEAPLENRQPEKEASANDKWDHSTGSWSLSMAALITMLIGAVLAAYATLVASHTMRRERSPGVM
jgi:ABC-type multidrug transport system ATPase subunit